MKQAYLFDRGRDSQYTQMSSIINHRVNICEFVYSLKFTRNLKINAMALLRLSEALHAAAKLWVTSCMFRLGSLRNPPLDFRSWVEMGSTLKQTQCTPNLVLACFSNIQQMPNRNNNNFLNRWTNEWVNEWRSEGIRNKFNLPIYFS